MYMAKSHPGFKAVASKIAAREHVSVKTADRELASRTRASSPSARAANPRLNRVKGK